MRIELRTKKTVIASRPISRYRQKSLFGRCFFRQAEIDQFMEETAHKAVKFQTYYQLRAFSSMHENKNETLEEAIQKLKEQYQPCTSTV